MKFIIASLSLVAFAVLPSAANADRWNKHWSVGSNPELRITAGDAAVIVEAIPAQITVATDASQDSS